ncbi:hypothetical protein ABH930_000213 [Kitasatospora sp. GAS204A]|nr:hypothetical protein [Kitasatospora sp. GAS204B]
MIGPRGRLVAVNDADGERDTFGEDEVRGLIAGWLAEPTTGLATDAEREADVDPWSATSLPLGTGLAVPPAPADAVITVARRLATEGLGSGPLPQPELGMRVLAEAMVLDEHPSVDEWSAADRAVALDWITLLIHRFGEDGVQRLIAALS